MIARAPLRTACLRAVALAALLAGGMLAGGSPLRARAVRGRPRGSALVAEHAARGSCPAAPTPPCERESAEGRSDSPAPGCDPVCPTAAALPRRPTRLALPATAAPFAALRLHRAHAGSESCSGTSLPPPGR